jgi:hypothetical protein
MLEGWEESEGLRGEIALAEDFGIPVAFMALAGHVS